MPGQIQVPIFHFNITFVVIRGWWYVQKQKLQRIYYEKYVLVSKMYARTSNITGTSKDNRFTCLCRFAWPGVSSIVENMSKVNEHKLIIIACGQG